MIKKEEAMLSVLKKKKKKQVTWLHPWLSLIN
jgi:hypothetical protein